MNPPLARDLFDLGEVVWVLHCAEGPVPRPAVEAARSFLEKESRPWEFGLDEWLGLPRRVRALAAALLGGEEADYTLTASTSSGLTAVAQALAWEPGDEVLVPLGEFPANVWPWKALQARGVGFRQVPLWEDHEAGARAFESAPPTAGADPETRILEALGARTRLVSVSWVRFQDGLVLDLPRLAAGCASRGVDLVVDGIQGAGVLPVPAAGLSAFATGVHKGLLAPQGAGLLWTPPRFRERLRPVGSWLSVEGGSDFRRPSTDFDRPWLADGRRFEQGGPGPLLCAALAQSLAVLSGPEPGAVASHVAGLQRRLLDELARRGAWGAEPERLGALLAAGRLGPILGFHHGGRGAAGLRSLLDEGFEAKVYASTREGYLRVALHGFHVEGDLSRVADWMAPSGR